MEAKEVKGLMEAYASIYESQEQIDEYAQGGGASPTLPGAEAFVEKIPSMLSNLKQKLTGATKPQPAQKKPQQQLSNSTIIIGHLISEGYAETEEAALKIMESMSDTWRESIVEKHSTFGYSADDPLEDFDQFVKKGPKTNKQKRQVIALNKKIFSKKED